MGRIKRPQILSDCVGRKSIKPGGGAFGRFPVFHISHR